jgi:hypothetical protein
LGIWMGAVRAGRGRRSCELGGDAKGLTPSPPPPTDRNTNTLLSKQDSYFQKHPDFHSL